jgi:hypothetical protein
VKITAKKIKTEDECQEFQTEWTKSEAFIPIQQIPAVSNFQWETV